MGTILCATRGGEASYRTQDRAIEIARERGDKLLFIFVSDINFLSHTSAPVLVDVEGEMENMGEFLLLAAEERARNAGIEAEHVVRQGDFREQLKEAAKEYQVEMVILGRPGKEGSVTKLQMLEELVKEIEQELGIEAVIV